MYIAFPSDDARSRREEVKTTNKIGNRAQRRRSVTITPVDGGSLHLPGSLTSAQTVSQNRLPFPSCLNPQWWSVAPGVLTLHAWLHGRSRLLLHQMRQKAKRCAAHTGGERLSAQGEARREPRGFWAKSKQTRGACWRRDTSAPDQLSPHTPVWQLELESAVTEGDVTRVDRRTQHGKTIAGLPWGSSLG